MLLCVTQSVAPGDKWLAVLIFSHFFYMCITQKLVTYSLFDRCTLFKEEAVGDM